MRDNTTYKLTNVQTSKQSKHNTHTHTQLTKSQEPMVSIQVHTNNKHIDNNKIYPGGTS